MTAKEKAEDLLLKFSILPDGNNKLVIDLALLCASEVIDADSLTIEEFDFWCDVKHELNLIKDEYTNNSKNRD